MSFQVSTVKSSFWRVPNIFPPYRGPLFGSRPRPRLWPGPYPSLRPTPFVRAEKGRSFFWIFVYSLTFSQNFFCNIFSSKFPMRTHVPTHNTHKTQTVHVYCTHTARTHNTHLPTRPTTLARTLALEKRTSKKKPKEVILLEHVTLFAPFFSCNLCTYSNLNIKRENRGFWWNTYVGLEHQASKKVQIWKY